jgi:HAD superfamily hydrolase (TIGR01509 family)
MIEALLFDLGGVIINIDFGRSFEVWGRHAGVPASQLSARFSVDDAGQRHERGEIDASQYYAALRQSLQIDLSDAQFEEGWNALILDERHEITRQIAALKPGIPLYVFSNANDTHKRHWERHHSAVLAPFRRVFVSSDIGLRKPDVAAFHHVAREIGVLPERILFFDDLLPNVEGARRAGLEAVHVTTPASVAAALKPFL